MGTLPQQAVRKWHSSRQQGNAEQSQLGTECSITQGNWGSERLGCVGGSQKLRALAGGADERHVPCQLTSL